MKYPDLILQLQSTVGAAVWQFQALETTLVNLVLLGVKLQRNSPRDVVDAVYEQHETMTMGRLSTLAQECADVPKPLLDQLSTFVNKRNWVVHKSWSDVLPNNHSSSALQNFVFRISDIADEGLELNKAFAKIVQKRAIDAGVTKEFIDAQANKILSKWFAG